jgi:GntR family transcriptional regulator, transcriptional repressor for pyruvate dehydrogenase complex
MLSDQVYDQVLAMLGSGAWPKGARLPSEQELARRFSVSRPILRQALARLRTEGRVHSRKGAGTYVLDEPRPAAAIAFAPLASIPEVRSFLEFRCSVESEMAARAAQCADAAAIARIGAAHRGLEAAFAAGEPGIDQDVAFHRAVAEATGNRFFVATLAALADQIAFGIRLTRELAQRPAAERFAALECEHRAIVQAMEAGDAEAARLAMRDHLASGIRRLFGS